MIKIETKEDLEDDDSLDDVPRVDYVVEDDSICHPAIDTVELGDLVV